MPLGEGYDLSLGAAPVDLATAGATGGRINLSMARSLTVVVLKGAGTAGEDPVLTLKRHNAMTGGTTQDHAVITKYYTKQETTLDGDEDWTENTQSAAATITGDGTSAETQMLIVFNVRADSLPAGYHFLSVNIADVGVAAQLGAVLYILEGVRPKGNPTTLRTPMRLTS